MVMAISPGGGWFSSIYTLRQGQKFIPKGNRCGRSQIRAQIPIPDLCPEKPMHHLLYSSPKCDIIKEQRISRIYGSSELA
jgi:hypothetical protein